MNILFQPVSHPADRQSPLQSPDMLLSCNLECLMLFNFSGINSSITGRKRNIMKKKSTSAFTLVEILVVVAIIALLAAISIPSITGAYDNASTRIKQTNVDTIEAAKEQYALLNNLPDGTEVEWDDIKDYVGSGILSLDELDVNEETITINAIGTLASYPEEE
jgi:prepilin-type N-terminal cleavage/methylation domain-containing protein